MDIVHERGELERYMREAIKVTFDSPVLLDRFLDDAVEMDVDAVSDGKEVRIGGVMQHIEQAGVHSGDSACSIPPYSLDPQIVEEVKRQTRLMAKALGVVGLMNVQFAIQHAFSDHPKSSCSKSIRALPEPFRLFPSPPDSSSLRSPPAVWSARVWKSRSSR